MKVPILVPNIFDHPFTYESGKIDLKLGDYVLIPFGKSNITGVVWNHFEKENNKKFFIKKIISKLNIPPLNVRMLLTISASAAMGEEQPPSSDFRKSLSISVQIWVFL